MADALHRTAVFTLPHPTQTARKQLERAFRDYARAYGTLLYVAYLRFGQSDDLLAGRTSGLDALRGLATYAIDEKTSTPRQSARTITQRLYSGEQLPPQAKEALERLPSRLRQSAREQAGQTLMSYLALADTWLTTPPNERGGAPSFPRRLRAEAVQQQRAQALTDLATLANHQRREQQVVTQLLTTREPDMPAIPFVGVADTYGCALYYSAETGGYWARLDIGAPTARDAAPLSMHGVYTQIKSGERWASESYLAQLRARGEPIEGIQSFGRAKGRLWLPLKLDEVSGRAGKRASYHQRPIRFTRTAFLPTAEGRQQGVLAAEPVTAKLVRRTPHTYRNPNGNPNVGGDIWYQFHVTFALPEEALAEARAYASDGLTAEQRPILAIHRGLRHLYTAALITPDGVQEIAVSAASGDDLLARQAAIERVRQQQQQRGKQPLTVRDRRQSRIADQEIQVCANQIIEMARQAHAQLVFEDLRTFASGAALRATQLRPAARNAAFRALLNRRQFEAVRQAVEQRLPLVGLPPVRIVTAAAISQTCTRCGARDRRSFEERRTAAERAGPAGLDFDPRTFVCPVCGYTRDVDALAAVNEARKLVWLRVRGDEKREGVADDQRASWEQWVSDLCAGLGR